jgi:hypothetical protein
MERLVRDVTSDDYTPEGVVGLDKRGRAVLDAAYDLAADDEWSEPDAVAELLRIAGRHRDALRDAENNARHGGRYRDFEIENRAQRLLEAAISGDPVRQPTEEDQRRFTVIEAFESLPEAERWRRLLAAVPHLEQLGHEATEGAFVFPAELADRSAPQAVRTAAADHYQARMQNLNQRLDSLLGPRSESTDPLLGSAYARAFVRDYLTSPRVRR